MIKVKVDPGICGLTSTLVVERSNSKTVLIETETECKAIAKWGSV